MAGKSQKSHDFQGKQQWHRVVQINIGKGRYLHWGTHFFIMGFTGFVTVQETGNKPRSMLGISLSHKEELPNNGIFPCLKGDSGLTSLLWLQLGSLLSVDISLSSHTVSKLASSLLPHYPRLI